MKKSIFAICIAALMLTGCSNTATSGGSTADTDSKAETVSSDVSDTESKEEVSETAEEELKYKGSAYQTIEIPYPARFEQGPGSLNELYIESDVYYNDKENTIYYSISSVPVEEEIDSLDNLLEDFYITEICNWVQDAYESSVLNKFEDFSISSKEEKEILGNKSLRVSGIISTLDKQKVNFTAYFSLFPPVVLDEGDSSNYPVPTMWIAFTTSNDEKVLADMNYIADLPLTKAKINE